MKYEEIDSLLDLEENWDSYGSKPIDKRALFSAKKLQIFPSPGGGINIHLALDTEVEIEIDSDGSIESVFWARK